MDGDRGDEARRLLLSRLGPILQTIAQAGGEAVVVGGAVRDAFLGRLAGDIDVATSLRPADVLAAFPGAIASGMAYGTVTVVGNGFTCHITTFRAEGGYRDARHPEEVVFGVSLEEDLARRDFTMNAIALRPDGHVVDPCGGREDITARVIRAVGDPAERIAEDALRMLRALRFESELCFLPDERLQEALVAQAPQVVRVHAERLWPEVARLLVGPCAERAVARGSPLLCAILPGLESRPLSDLPGDPITRLCRLCEGAAPEDVAQRLLAMAAGKAQATRAGRLLRLLAEAPSDDAYTLRRAVTMAGAEDLETLTVLGGGTWAMAKALAAREGALFRLALTGTDIAKAGGRTPGPWVGETISRLWELVWHDPDKNNPPDLIEAVRQHLRAIPSDRED